MSVLYYIAAALTLFGGIVSQVRLQQGAKNTAESFGLVLGLLLKLGIVALLVVAGLRGIA